MSELLRSAAPGERPVSAPSPEQARRAGWALLMVTAVIGAMVAVIVAARLLGGGSVGALSLALPLLGLAWLTWLGRKTLRCSVAPETAPATPERPSRRPAQVEPVTSRKSSPPDRSNQQVSA